MPVLAGIFAVLVSWPSQLFAHFLALFGRKFTVATASVLAFLATTTTLIVCLKSILSALVALIVMPSWIATAIAWLIPSNFISITSLIISGRICKTVYHLVQRKIDLITNAT